MTMEAYQRLVKELAVRRRDLSITQNEIARVLKMPQSGVARLESCKHEPKLSTVLSYAEVLGRSLEFGDNGFRPITPALCAIEIRKLLDEVPPDTAAAFREVTELIRHWDYIPLDGKAAAVAQKPITTKYPRFDALLAGVVEMLCLESHLSLPGWVSDPEYFLERFEWFTPIPSLEALAFANTPPPIALRGVFVDERSLRSV